jgi:hypothetical protein
MKMNYLSKIAMLGAAAATIVAATPADARDRGYGRGHDGIDAGDVIAGALIIGGIAAIASASSRNDRSYGRGYGRYDDRRYNDRGWGYNDGGYGYYNNGYNSRRAVDQCVQAARRDASRYGWARVTDVTSIERVRGGYAVRGRLVVDRGGRGSDRGYYYDRYDDRYDKGRFTCVTRYGGVDDLRLGGLRGSDRW